MLKNKQPKEKTYFTPKYVKKKIKLMKCTYEGCENTFMAYPHARFCDFHKDISTRPKEKKVEENTMFIFKGNFKEKVLIERGCDCCGHPYRIEVYPGREDYPRFCEEHRSEYKRINWRETHGKK